MTAINFVELMEAYYGKYNPTMRAVVLEYLTHDVNIDLKLLSKHVLEEHNSQYKSPPDVAVFAKIKKAIKKHDPNIYYNGRCLGHYAGGRFIPDLTSLKGDQITRFVEEKIYSKSEFINFLDRLDNPALEDKNAKILQVEAPEQGDDL